MLDLVFQNFTADKSLQKDFFENIVKETLKELRQNDKKVEVSINIVGEGRIRELNRKYRQKNKVTDVLSFPLGRESGFTQYGTIPLGDIFICLPFAKKEAKRENIGIERKIAQLVVHGFLHLLGHKHEKSKIDAGKMLSLESRILKHISY